MTRRDYIKFANMFANGRALAEQLNDPGVRVQTLRYAVIDAATIFASDNENFDRNRFYDAAGFPELKVN